MDRDLRITDSGFELRTSCFGLRVETCLAQCIYQSILDSQLPRKIINYRLLGFVGESAF